MLIDRLYQTEAIEANEFDLEGVNDAPDKWAQLIHSDKEKFKRISYLFDKLDKKECWLLSNNQNIKKQDIVWIKPIMQKAQKIFATEDFVNCCFERMATIDTLIQAKPWFKLIHNPLWIEWVWEGGFRSGSLMFANEGDDKIDYIVFAGMEKFFHVNMYYFYPDSLHKNGDDPVVDLYDRNCVKITEGFDYSTAIMMMDFIIRINSPKISQIKEGENLERLNKQRMKGNKEPYFSYNIVDVSENIKKDIKSYNANGDINQRMHWRRGHFKCRKSGVFWWNPHLAGKKELGLIEKVYVA